MALFGGRSPSRPFAAGPREVNSYSPENRAAIVSVMAETFAWARRRAFGLTWLSYATYYFARKSFPVTKARIQSDVGIDTSGLALIDTTFLTAYAVGQFASGWVGDRIGARRLIGFGMLASAAVCILFGMSSALPVFALALGLNGLFQSTGWPGNIKAMAAWYGPKERGAVMGFWCTCFQVGPLVATALAALLMKHLGWRYAFYGPGLWVALVGLLVLFFLKEAPETPQSGRADEIRVSISPDEVRAARRAAVRNPIVWLLGLSYLGLKLIRYCIDFWQPYFLEKGLGYSGEIAAYASTSFQMGGILGAVVVGTISDRYFSDRRAAVAMVSTFALGIALVLYALVARWGLVPNVLAMALVGFCLFGPDALISGVAAQDLGGPVAGATVAGLINGCGSVGAIAQGFVFASVSKAYGGQSVFYALMAFAVFSSAALGYVRVLQRRAQMVPAVAPV
jgi:sugar phosphate permease